MKKRFNAVVPSPIRVAQIIGSTGLYGAEHWILALMHFLDSQKIQSTLVNLVDRPGENSYVVKAAKERNLDAVDVYTGGRFNPGSVLSFTKWVRANHYHILHSHGYKSDILGLLTARLSGKKTMSTPHGWSRERDWKLRMYESLDRNLLRFVDRICPLSIELSQEFRELGVSDKKIKMILNGVNIEEIDGVKPLVKEESDQIVIGYIGQLIKRKNLPCLFAAFKKVADTKRNIKLMIVGDGPFLQVLQGQVENMGLQHQVIFTGYSSDSIAMLKTFDLFVLPSCLEGIPRCLMEAMAAYVPVVASDIPGTQYLVKHKKTGLLFPSGQSEDLAKRILYTLDHPQEREEMTRRARKKIEDVFSAKRMAEEYTALYQELIPG